MRAATVAKEPRAASTTAPRRPRLRLEAGERLAGGDELGGESVALCFGCGIRLDQVFVLDGEAVTCGGGLLRRRDRCLCGGVRGSERGDTVSAGTRRGIGVGGTRRAGGLGSHTLFLRPRGPCSARRRRGRHR